MKYRVWIIVALSSDEVFSSGFYHESFILISNVFNNVREGIINLLTCKMIGDIFPPYVK